MISRLGVMMTLAPVLGGLSALVGLYISWSWDFPVGGTIVLVLTAVFLAAWVASPRHGLLATYLRRVTRAPVSEDTAATA